jgi:D-threonate/D-erythronate kinase
MPGDRHANLRSPQPDHRCPLANQSSPKPVEFIPEPATQERRPLLIIADDLTGACDAAVAFTASHGPIRVELTAKHPAPGLPVQALITVSRDVRPREGDARIREIALHLPQDAEVFKKIDSVFRGNTAAELCASLHRLPYDLAVLAPAYPALGRRVRQGSIYIQDVVGDRTIALSTLLANLGCEPHALPAGLPQPAIAEHMRRALDHPSRAILCDAWEQADLTEIVHAAHSLEKRILWIGSGGLAHALAAQFQPVPTAPATPHRRGSILFFIGSPHPVTRAQLQHLQQNSDASARIIPIVLSQTTESDIRTIATSLAPQSIGCLLMTGGDTAHFVCRALGINALRLEREFAPGVPLATAEEGPFDGTPVVLKSGGFGEPDLFCRLLETFRAGQEVPA